MSQHILEVNDDNFEAEVLNSELPVLVDFWAAWCAPCKAIAPVLEELAVEYKDEFKIVKVNIDQNQNLAEQYEISSIPNLLFFADDEQVDQQIGFTSKKELENKIKAVI